MRAIVSLFEKISDEIAGWVEKESLVTIAKFSMKSILAVGITLGLSFPKESGEAIYQIISHFNFFVPKFAFSVCLVWWIYPALRKRAIGDNTGVVEGVPVSELVDHIILEQSFRRDDIESKFALPRNRYQTLANRLDDHFIFDRGENNKRVLREGVSREDIVFALRGTPLPDKVFGISEILKDWLYSHTKPKSKVVAEEIETDWKPKKIPRL